MINEVQFSRINPMARIGFDAKRVFHNFRGLGNYSRTLIESLVRQNPENEYILFTPPFSDPRAKEWHKRFENLEVVQPTSSLGKTFSSSWRSLFLADTVKKKNLDIYHGLSHELPPGLKKRGIKSIVTIHDLIFMRYPEFFPWIDRQIYLLKFRASVEQADLVVAICEQTKRDCIDFLGCSEEKIRVVYQSCHQTFYSGASEETKNHVKEKYQLSDHFILFVGAIEERKNTLALVRAFARLKDIIPHDLILVGRGKEYLKEVEKEIVHQGLNDRVKHLDTVTDDELPSMYQMADLFVFPSFFEGWGIPNVEALFSGTPVITSQGSCFPESAGPHSVYINPHNVEDIVEKMEKVLFDDELRETMIRQGREYAEQFHWKNTANSLIEVYQEIL